MKKVLVAVVVMGIVALITGCSSVQVANKFNGLPLDNAIPRGHVNVNITGLYFLGFLPVVSGNAMSSGSCVFFKNTVNAQNAVYMLTRNARALGATKMHNVVTEFNTPFPFLFTYKTINASCSITSNSTPSKYQAR